MSLLNIVKSIVSSPFYSGGCFPFANLTENAVMALRIVIHFSAKKQNNSKQNKKKELPQTKI